jgi:hypothetical protein
MNTIESRRRLAELSARAIEILEPLAAGAALSSASSLTMREILNEARESVYDAGYPGDAAGRAILHASVYITTPQDDIDAEFWQEAILDLRIGIDGLGVVETANT